METGILLHISSLASPGGIGTLGRAAYEFVDFLRAAGQKYWQVLPTGPTGYGDSPYQSFSAFAGNPYFIDLDTCVAEGLTRGKKLPSYDFGRGAFIDYGKLFSGRLDALRFIYDCKNFDIKAVNSFAADNSYWLDDYALFAALKIHFGHIPLADWPEDIKMRRPAALKEYSEKLEDAAAFHKFVQYLFFSQFQSLKKYAARNGVRIIGDVPIYAGYDSADVWSRPQLFDLNESLDMNAVAGVPPDYFSADGQLWGNPLYDWQQLKKDGFDWWLKRLKHTFLLFDMVRIDHFRAFDSYYAVPAGAVTAATGKWRQGPGMELFSLVNKAFGAQRIIAEDLGEITDGVRRLIKDAGYPGMRVLQFAFDGNPENPHLPENYKEPCVVYTGTHDNMTVRGWYNSLSPAQKKRVRAASGYDKEKHSSIAAALIETAFNSPAQIVVIPIQDYLFKDNSARMNRPAVPQGNWRWRLRPGEINQELAAEIKRQGVK